MPKTNAPSPSGIFMKSKSATVARVRSSTLIYIGNMKSIAMTLGVPYLLLAIK